MATNKLIFKNARKSVKVLICLRLSVKLKEMVKPKKYLGQHFLEDESIAQNIVKLLGNHTNYRLVLEIGPGMGVLTKYLVQNSSFETYVVEIDGESVNYLKKNFPLLNDRIICGDILRLDLQDLFKGEKTGLIGNFPYNISSQIFFHLLKYKDQVPEVVCMLQKEVAERLASPPGSKAYGILSVFLQAYYDIEYKFTVTPGSFFPPPKVHSGVIRLQRNQMGKLDCNEELFRKVVKVAFQTRRKTLRNALQPLLAGKVLSHPLMEKRAEQLAVADFVGLTNQIESIG